MNPVYNNHVRQLC